LKRRTEVKLSKLVTHKLIKLTAFIIVSTSASLETSPPKVMAWPPDASIFKIEEYKYQLGYSSTQNKTRHKQQRKKYGPY
jgi:hypothetical protein